MFEEKVVRRVLGPKREDITGRWKICM